MEITTIPVTRLLSNCHIVANGSDCVLVDVGGDSEVIDRKIKELGLSVSAVLLTHGHGDHVGGAKYFQDKGVKIYVGKADAEMLTTGKNLSAIIGIECPKFCADVLVSDGDKLQLIGKTFLCLATPGHTEGGMCYKVDNAIFTGDTLFHLSIGRSDFPGGSYMKLINSIGEKLLTLDEDYTLYCGHGSGSTLNFERAHNPYIGGGENDI